MGSGIEEGYFPLPRCVYAWIGKVYVWLRCYRKRKEMLTLQSLSYQGAVGEIAGGGEFGLHAHPLRALPISPRGVAWQRHPSSPRARMRTRSPRYAKKGIGCYIAGSFRCSSVIVRGWSLRFLVDRHSEFGAGISIFFPILAQGIEKHLKKIFLTKKKGISKFILKM